MTRRLSLPGRRVFDGLDRSNVPLVLMEISHAALASPLRLSTDATQRLSTDPLRYGTRCAWRGADPEAEPFLFVAADLEWPGELEDAVPEARIVLSLLHSTLLEALRAVPTPATVNLALALSGHLEQDPEEEHLGMELISAEAELSAGASVELTLSHLPIEVETFPAHRMTQRAFPGLFR